MRADTRRFLIAVLGFCFFSSSLAWAQPAGLVIAVQPEATAERGGIIRILQLKDDIDVLDVLSTGSEGRLQIFFSDDSTITLGPNTTLAVSQFAPGGPKPESKLDIAKGAVRFVTGKVTEKNPDGFKMETPEAVIGIRGTGGLVEAGPGWTNFFLFFSAKTAVVNGSVVLPGQWAKALGQYEPPAVESMTMDERRRAEELTAGILNPENPNADNFLEFLALVTQVGERQSGDPDPVNSSISGDLLIVDYDLADDPTSGGLPIFGPAKVEGTLTPHADFNGRLGNVGITATQYGFNVNLNNGSISQGYMIINANNNTNYLRATGGTGTLSGAAFQVTNFSGQGIIDGRGKTVLPNTYLGGRFNSSTPGEGSLIVDSEYGIYVEDLIWAGEQNVSYGELDGGQINPGEVIVPALPIISHAQVTGELAVRDNMFNGFLLPSGGPKYGFNVNLSDGAITKGYLTIAANESQYVYARGGTGQLTGSNFSIGGFSGTARYTDTLGNDSHHVLDSAQTSVSGKVDSNSPNFLDLVVGGDSTFVIYDDTGLISDGTLKPTPFGNDPDPMRTMTLGRVEGNLSHPVQLGGQNITSGVYGFNVNINSGAITHAYMNISTTDPQTSSINLSRGTGALAGNTFDVGSFQGNAVVGGTEKTIHANTNLSGTMVDAGADGSAVASGTYEIWLDSSLEMSGILEDGSIREIQAGQLHTNWVEAQVSGNLRHDDGNAGTITKTSYGFNVNLSTGAISQGYMNLTAYNASNAYAWTSGGTGTMRGGNFSVGGFTAGQAYYQDAVRNVQLTGPNAAYFNGGFSASAPGPGSQRLDDPGSYAVYVDMGGGVYDLYSEGRLSSGVMTSTPALVSGNLNSLSGFGASGQYGFLVRLDTGQISQGRLDITGSSAGDYVKAYGGSGKINAAVFEISDFRGEAKVGGEDKTIHESTKMTGQTDSIKDPSKVLAAGSEYVIMIEGENDLPPLELDHGTLDEALLTPVFTPVQGIVSGRLMDGGLDAGAYSFVVGLEDGGISKATMSYDHGGNTANAADGLGKVDGADFNISNFNGTGTYNGATYDLRADTNIQGEFSNSTLDIGSTHVKGTDSTFEINLTNNGSDLAATFNGNLDDAVLTAAPIN